MPTTLRSDHHRTLLGKAVRHLLGLDALPLNVRRGIFLIGAALSLTPWASPGLALGLGMVLALAHENPYQKMGRKAAKPLLQFSVVLLGFGMNLMLLLQAGLQGLLFAAGTILATFGLGWVFARWLRIQRITSTLISAGTAICGGSAIAAVGSLLGAAEGEMSVWPGIYP